MTYNTKHPSSEKSEHFRVELKKIVDDSYDIEIGHSLMPSLLADIKTGLLGNAKRFALITDSAVRPLYAEPIAGLIADAGYRVKIYSFPSGEESKSRRTKEQIEDAMLSDGCRRDCAVIAVGGGVVTDLAGFVAGTFGRGVPFVNYATSLLAAADASVGGKTAVDTPLATNLIGLIYQPKKVYLDLDTWKTLPEREIRSGLAETIKHACIADAGFFEYLEKNIEAVIALDDECCGYIARRNCDIKYHVVMKDERESGLREVLNLGHTVGRAIETLSGYRLLHGEAVAIGLAAEAELAKRMGHLSENDQGRMLSLLERAGLPTAIPGYIDREALVQKLYTDKKVRDGKLRFVIQDGIGSIFRFGDNVYAVPVSEDEARKVIFSLQYS